MSNEQDRYLTHQAIKKEELIELMKERHSQRRFDDRDVEDSIIDEIVGSTALCSSSCDRHGVKIKIVKSRDDKALLSGLLVGGTGWIHRAPVILMLFGNKDVYKGGDNGDEFNYNSYLDAGIMMQHILVLIETLGLHGCVCNPQVRKENRDFFYDRFEPFDSVFCGAIAIGYPHKEQIYKVRNENIEMKA